MQNQTDNNSSVAKVALWVFLAATGFLIWRTHELSLKVADFLFMLSGLLVILDRKFLSLMRPDWRSVWRPLVRHALLFVLAIVAAQIVAWPRYDISPFRTDIALEYARLLLNFGVFFLAAFFIYYHGRKLILQMSAVILLSFAAILPAYIPRWQMNFISHDRLSGLLENPIVFGAWAMAAFFIGLGFFLSSKKVYAKVLLSAVLAVLANFILWSNTRSVWIALLAGIAVIVLLYYLKDRNFRKIEWILSITLIAFLVGYIIFAYTPQRHRTNVEERVLLVLTQPLSYQDRTIVWGESLPRIYRSPIGFGLYGKEIPQGFPGSSNTYLEVMIGGGIAALLALTLMVLRIAGNIKIALKKRGGFSPDDITTVWFVLLPATLVVIFFFDFLLVRTLWFTLGTIMGISLRERYRLSNPA